MIHTCSQFKRPYLSSGYQTIPNQIPISTDKAPFPIPIINLPNKLAGTQHVEHFVPVFSAKRQLYCILELDITRHDLLNTGCFSCGQPHLESPEPILIDPLEYLYTLSPAHECTTKPDSYWCGLNKQAFSFC